MQTIYGIQGFSGGRFHPSILIGGLSYYFVAGGLGLITDRGMFDFANPRELAGVYRSIVAYPFIELHDFAAGQNENKSEC